MEQIEREFLEEQRRKMEGDQRPQPEKPSDKVYVYILWLRTKKHGFFGKKLKLKLAYSIEAVLILKNESLRFI